MSAVFSKPPAPLLLARFHRVFERCGVSVLFIMIARTSLPCTPIDPGAGGLFCAYGLATMLPLAHPVLAGDTRSRNPSGADLLNPR